MVEQLKAWLLSFADSNSCADLNGKTGLLKIYTNRNAVPRRRNAISLDRIIEHCGVTREVACAAIGELDPVVGAGERLHVILVTPTREQNDQAIAKFKREANKDNQARNWSAFMVAANRLNDELPAFGLPETVN